MNKFRHYLLIAACKAVVFFVLIALAAWLLFNPLSIEKTALVLAASLLVLTLGECAIAATRKNDYPSAAAKRRMPPPPACQKDLQRIAAMPLDQVLDDAVTLAAIIEKNPLFFPNLNPQQFIHLAKIFLETVETIYGKQAAPVNLGELKSFVAADPIAHGDLCRAFIANYQSYMAGSFAENFLELLEQAGETWADVIGDEAEQTGRVMRRNA